MSSCTYIYSFSVFRGVDVNVAGEEESLEEQRENAKVRGTQEGDLKTKKKKNDSKL